jgi:putative ABC transport system permease protein
MPRTFELGVDWLGEGGEGLWVPLPSYSVAHANQEKGEVIARLRPGVTLSAAKAELGMLSAVFAKRFPASARGVELVAAPPALSIDPAVRIGLLILLGAVACLLLLASVNVSALLVARARTRARELAIRTALGAGRLRIVRQLLVESCLLALAGGALGLSCSFWGTRVLAALAPSGIPRLDRIHLDRNVLWFTLAISLLTALLFGLLPAFQASSRRMGSALKQALGDSFAGPPERQRQPLRNALVVVEVALAVVLVICGTLLARSLNKLMQIDPGVRAEHVLAMTVRPSNLFCDPNNWRATCLPVVRNLLDGIGALPTVERTALTEGGPLKGGFVRDTPALMVEGLEGGQSYRGIERSVTPGFFAVMGIRLMAGRDFASADLTNNAPVAIVSDAFARKYVSGNPLGRRFSAWNDVNGHPEWAQIIGVVNDVRDRALRNPFEGDGPYYRPFQYSGNRFSVVTRTSSDPSPMAGAIEHVVSSIDPHAPIANVETVDQILFNSSAPARFEAIVMGSFSTVALVLAAVGIYGVISYSTVQRTHEISMRVALGAQPGDVIRLVVGQGATLTLSWIAIGLLSALLVTRFLRSVLFEVAPTDAATFVGVAVLFLIVAVAACSIPARRAMRVEPLVALRIQ